MTCPNREIDLQHRYFLYSKTSLWILQMAASRSFLGGWGTSISPHETGQYRTVLLSCDVETLNGTADTVALGWSDKKHTMTGLSLWWIARWTMGGCALLAVRAVTAFLPASRQGFRWLLPFFSAVFVVAPQGYFWKACGGKRISKENQCAPSTSLLVSPETPSLIVLLMKVRRDSWQKEEKRKTKLIAFIKFLTSDNAILPFWWAHCISVTSHYTYA